MHPIIEKFIESLNRPPKTDKVAGLFIAPQAVYLVTYPNGNQSPLITDMEPVLDVKAILKSLKTLLERNTLNHTQVNIAFAASLHQLMAVDKPDVDEADLATALKYSAKDYIQGNIEDAIIEYFDIPEQPFGQSKVNLVSVKRELVAPVVTLVQAAHMVINQISVEELIYKDCFQQSDEAVMILSQQKDDDLCLQIHKQGKLFFYRKLRGYNKLYQFAPLEINNGAADNLSLEIQRSLDYFESQLRQAPVKRIYLLIPSKYETELIDAIGQNFPLPVLTYRSWVQPYLSETMTSDGYLTASSIAIGLIEGEGNEA